jgi:hypothetical protein
MKTNNIIHTMKIKYVMLALPLISATASFGQFKLYSIGSISIGSIIQPPANIEMQVSGNSLFSNGGSITSAAFIQGSSMFSNSLKPDYSWWGNDSTGIFHPSLNVMAFSINGVEAMRFSAADNILVGSQTDNGDRLQVTAGLNANTFDLYSNASAANIYSGKNYVNNSTTKAWAVENGATEEFYVLGSGQAYSYGWNLLSDSTLKENVAPINNALQKVLQLQGVTYNYKKDRVTSGATPQQMGLLAQAVQRVVPEVVSTTDKGLKTVAYGNLVGLLIEALKQEDKKVNALNKEIDSINKSEAFVEPAKYNEAIEVNVPLQCNAASMLLFDLTGALKKTIPLEKGKQNISLTADNIPAGIYYYSLVIDGQISGMRKIVILNSKDATASSK